MHVAEGCATTSHWSRRRATRVRREVHGVVSSTGGSCVNDVALHRINLNYVTKIHTAVVALSEYRLPIEVKLTIKHSDRAVPLKINRHEILDN